MWGTFTWGAFEFRKDLQVTGDTWLDGNPGPGEPRICPPVSSVSSSLTSDENSLDLAQSLFQCGLCHPDSLVAGFSRNVLTLFWLGICTHGALPSVPGPQRFHSGFLKLTFPL